MPDVAAELVVDVAADPEREVHLLRLEPGDLAAEDLVRRRVVGARRAQQLVVALVAAEDRVGQVEEDDRRLGEVRVALVLDAARGHDVAGRGDVDDARRSARRPGSARRRSSGWPASGSLRMLARRYHDERCQNRLAAASASAWVASRRSVVGRPGGAPSAAAIGKSARMALRLNASVPATSS